MAVNDKNPDPNAKPEPHKLSLRTIILVVGVMILEAAVLLGVAVFTGAPAVKADQGFQAGQDPSLDKVVEVPVLRERFPNNKQGVLYLYDTSITVRVDSNHQEEAQAFVDANQALIKTRIAALWRNAEPRHFNEPLLSTLTRQAEEAMREIFPHDPKSGESVIKSVLLEGVTPYRAGI